MNNQPRIHGVWIYRADATDSRKALADHEGKVITPIMATSYPETRELLGFDGEPGILSIRPNKQFYEIARYEIDQNQGEAFIADDILGSRWNAVMRNAGRLLGERAPLDERVMLLTGPLPRAIGIQTRRNLFIDGKMNEYHLTTMAEPEMRLIRESYEETQIRRAETKSKLGEPQFIGEMPYQR